MTTIIQTPKVRKVDNHPFDLRKPKTVVEVARYGFNDEKLSLHRINKESQRRSPEGTYDLMFERQGKLFIAIKNPVRADYFLNQVGTHAQACRAGESEVEFPVELLRNDPREYEDYTFITDSDSEYKVRAGALWSKDTCTIEGREIQKIGGIDGDLMNHARIGAYAAQEGDTVSDLLRKRDKFSQFIEVEGREIKPGRFIVLTLSDAGVAQTGRAGYKTSDVKRMHYTQ